MFWAQALAAQDKDAGLKEQFQGFAAKLAENEKTIIDELNAAQGKKVEIGGYYYPDGELASDAMRPSDTLNKLIAAMAA